MLAKLLPLLGLAVLLGGSLYALWALVSFVLDVRQCLRVLKNYEALKKEVSGCRATLIDLAGKIRQLENENARLAADMNKLWAWCRSAGAMIKEMRK